MWQSVIWLSIGSQSSLVPADDTSLYSVLPSGCYSPRISLTPGAALDYIPNTFLHSLIFPRSPNLITCSKYNITTQFVCVASCFTYIKKFVIYNVEKLATALQNLRDISLKKFQLCSYCTCKLTVKIKTKKNLITVKKNLRNKFKFNILECYNQFKRNCIKTKKKIKTQCLVNNDLSTR